MDALNTPNPLVIDFSITLGNISSNIVVKKIFGLQGYAGKYISWNLYPLLVVDELKILVQQTENLILWGMYWLRWGYESIKPGLSAVPIILTNLLNIHQVYQYIEIVIHMLLKYNVLYIPKIISYVYIEHLWHRVEFNIPHIESFLLDGGVTNS